MKNPIATLVLPIVLAAATSLAAPAAEAARVVASIKPIHSLVAAVMAGIGEPALIVDGTGSPHTFALRPSDAKRLAEADLVVWVGPSLETFLAKPIAALPRNAVVVTLAETPGMRLLTAREGGPWGAYDHGHGHAHGHKHGAAEVDGHLWLDPENAMKIVDAVAAALATRDPANAARYRANAAASKVQVSALDAELARRLGPVADIPFLVFHDAYQYFERRYGIRAVGAIAVAPDRALGARRIHELRQRVADTKVRCVFSEPQFNPKLVATVVENSPVRTAVLDPLGAAIADGADLYPALMRGIAASIVGCLAPTS